MCKLLKQELLKQDEEYIEKLINVITPNEKPVLKLEKQIEVSYEVCYDDENFQEDEFFIFVELTDKYEDIRIRINSINCEEISEGCFVVYMSESDFKNKMLALGIKMTKMK